jgi:hypothetical protein
MYLPIAFLSKIMRKVDIQMSNQFVIAHPTCETIERPQEVIELI